MAVFKYSVASKQVGVLFKFLWPFQKSWTLTYLYSFQKHNLIFLRFHDISNDIRQRGRRGKYSFDYEKLQKGQRASQMLHLKKVVKGPEDTKLKVIYFWHRH